MNTNSNNYTLIYSIILVLVVATVLTVTSIVLKPRQDKNIELEKKRNILAALHIDSNAENAETLFEEHIVEMFAVTRDNIRNDDTDPFFIDYKNELQKDLEKQEFPVYICKTDDGIKYLFELYGKGLWGPMWGYLALNQDLNTIYGVYFDHKSETPGLGAEVSTSHFQNQFKSKTIFENNVLVSIDLIKTKSTDNPHAVDAISGGTITSKGIKYMLEDGLNAYLKFISDKRNANPKED